MNEPRPKQIPHTWHRASGPVDDPYSWMRQRDDPDTLAYLRAENDYADAWFAQRTPLVDEIFAEIRSRTDEDDIAAPVPFGDWYYTTRTRAGDDYPVHCRGRTPASATDEIILDENREADGHAVFELEGFEIDPSHRWLAWAADVTGDEHSIVRIRDLTTGLDLDDLLVDVARNGLAWAADATHLFYTADDDQYRPYRVMRHAIGTPQAEDVEIFRDDDERFFVSVGATRSGSLIVIDTVSRQSSETWLIPASDPTADPRIVRSRAENVEYEVDDWGDRLVILTNHEAPDFRVATASFDDPSTWHDLVAHHPGRRITQIEPFADYLAIHQWTNAQPAIRVLGRDSSERLLDLDDEPHDLRFGPNQQWDTTTLRVVHQSLTSAPRHLDVEMAVSPDAHLSASASASGSPGRGDRGVTVVKHTPTPNVDLTNYTATRTWATAVDGTRVPIDVVHHVDTPLDGTAACCVYGYGAYDEALAPWFSTARLSLLDRHIVWALVHPRGGGELGRQWYLDGKYLNKRNTFTDTLAACNHLVDEQFASAERLAIRGGSAGGLLVGACITSDPLRFAAAVAEVPFVDVVTTMSDPSLPLTVNEWEEWGDPRSEPFASYIASYSPYDNTRPADYPALLVTAGLNDSRVGFHEPAKWVARLREVRTNDRPLLLRTELGAGHRGPTGRYDVWRDEARILTFMLDTTGSATPAPAPQ